ncbi:MAG: DUF523 domain-containing protein [Candidatus Brocadiia bacterium]
MAPVLVSACLLGVRCRYDGAAKSCARLREALAGKAWLAVCPEQLGGLPTPRPRQHLVGGDGHAVLDGKARVVNELGEDVTAQFLRGAQEVARLARLSGAQEAWLKSRSPSCGHGLVDVGGPWQEGDGVAAALLLREGVRVVAVD